METAKEFIGYILAGERRLAEEVLERLTQNSPCYEYAEVLKKVFLADVVKKINKDVAGVYCDADFLIKSMFAEGGIDFSSALEMVFDIVKENQKNKDKKTFEKAKGYILENLCDSQLSVSVVSEYAGTTQSNLIRLFQSSIETTPGDYISDLRLEKSKKLLLGGLSVSETAKEVGFSSSSGYIRAFKRKIGMTPGEWKRNKLFL